MSNERLLDFNAEVIPPPDPNSSWIPPRWLLTIIGAIAAFKFIQSLQELATFLTIAYLLGYLFQRPLHWLESKKVARVPGFLLISSLVVSITFFVLLAIVPHLIEQTIRLIEHLPSSLSQAEDMARGLLAKIPYINTLSLERFLNRARLTKMLNDAFTNSEFLSTLRVGALQAMLQGYSITLTLFNLFLLPLFVFYIAIEFPNLHHNALLLIPPSRRHDITQLATSVDETIMSFIKGQLVVGIIMAVLYVMGLLAIGLDLALPVGIIAGFGNLIPYLGTTVGILIALLLSLTGIGTFAHIILVLMVFAVVQFVEGFIITPRVVGQSVGLSPLIVIVSLMIGGKLFGLLGICLAVPLTAALKTVLRELLQKRARLIELTDLST